MSPLSGRIGEEMKSFLSVLIIAVTFMAMSSEAEAGRRFRLFHSCGTHCATASKVTTSEVVTSEVKVKVKNCQTKCKSKCKVVRETSVVAVSSAAITATQTTPVVVVEPTPPVVPATVEEPLAPMVPSDKL